LLLAFARVVQHSSKLLLALASTVIHDLNLFFPYSRSGKLLLALASTTILGFESRGTHGHISLPHDSGSLAIPASFLAGDGKLLLVSPAQSLLVSGSVGIHDHNFVLSRLLHVLKWGLFYDKMRDLTTTCQLRNFSLP
jgi:hypothetical protein